MMPYDPLFAKYYDYLVHDRREALVTEDDMAFLTEAFAGKDIREVLDAGCGTGRYLIPLVRDGYGVTGLDNSPDMLAQCAARLQHQGLVLRVMTVGEVIAYLTAVGFSDITVQQRLDTLEPESGDEELVFVAKRPS